MPEHTFLNMKFYLIKDKGIAKLKVYSQFSNKSLLKILLYTSSFLNCMTVTLASLKCVFLLHGKCSKKWLLQTLKKTLHCIIHISNIYKRSTCNIAKTKLLKKLIYWLAQLQGIVEIVI